jgi:hypothetical protein
MCSWTSARSAKPRPPHILPTAGSGGSAASAILPGRRREATSSGAVGPGPGGFKRCKGAQQATGGAQISNAVAKKNSRERTSNRPSSNEQRQQSTLDTGRLESPLAAGHHGGISVSIGDPHSAIRNFNGHRHCHPVRPPLRYLPTYLLTYSPWMCYSNASDAGGRGLPAANCLLWDPPSHCGSAQLVLLVDSRQCLYLLV